MNASLLASSRHVRWSCHAISIISTWFGFVTIPFLALTAFLIITLMMVVSMLSSEEEAEAGIEPADALARFGFDWVAVFAVIGIVLIWFVAAARLV